MLAFTLGAPWLQGPWGPCLTGLIANMALGGEISVIFGGQVSSCVHYCKRDEVYFTTLLWQNSGRQNGLISRKLFTELHKITVKKVTFVGFRRGDRYNPPHLDPPLILTNEIIGLYKGLVRTCFFYLFDKSLGTFDCKVESFKKYKIHKTFSLVHLQLLWGT